MATEASEGHARLAQGGLKQTVAAALASVGQQGIAGQTWRRRVVRTVLKFAGEPVDEDGLGHILQEST